MYRYLLMMFCFGVSPVFGQQPGHIYFLGSRLHWADAEAEAIAAGGHLVTVNDQAENDWLVNTFGQGSGHWIGLFQPAGSFEPNGGWQWANGEPFVYSNWAPGLPDNIDVSTGGVAQFAIMTPLDAGPALGGTWDDNGNIWGVGIIEKISPDCNNNQIADLLESDIDGDGIIDDCDNCPNDSNPLQDDADLDGVGDVCDTCPFDTDNDIDVDGFCGDVDNCPNDFNPLQDDADLDGVGDVCDTCPNYANPIQSIYPRADRDQDCDVDGIDFTAFASCFNKAGNPPRTVGCPPGNASAFDFNNDGDVDGIDFSLFASCYNGSGNPPRTQNCPQ